MDEGGVSQLLTTLHEELSKDSILVQVLTLFGQGEGFDPRWCQSVITAKVDIQHLRKHRMILKGLYCIFTPYIICRAIDIIQHLKPDIIVTNMWGSDILSLFIPHRQNYRLIIIQHDTVKLSHLLKILKTKALQKADSIVAISESVKDFLVDYFKAPNNKIEVIYNGINLESFLGCAKNNIDNNFVFGTVARLDKIKGHIYILEALKKLKLTDGLMPPFTLVGDGPARAELEKYVADNNLPNVKFVGQKVDIKPYLSRMDVFILPSLSEGLGVAIIEAMAAGKCVIASSIDGIKELVSNNKNGFLIEPRNSEEIYSKIKWCLKNKKEVLTMGQMARQYIIDNADKFDISKVALRYKYLFDRLMAD